MAKAIIKVVIAIIFILTAPSDAFASLVFSDNFNRANSNTVGNGWSEVQIGAGEDVGILNNKLAFPVSGSVTDVAVAHRSLASWGYNNLTIQFSISQTNTTSGYQVLSTGFDGTSRGIGSCCGYQLQVNIPGSSVRINDGSTVLISDTVSMSTGVDYYFRWDIESDNDMRVYMNTTGFTFSASDLILSVSDASPSQTYTSLGIASRYTGTFDDIELYSPVLAAAGAGGVGGGGEEIIWFLSFITPALPRKFIV